MAKTKHRDEIQTQTGQQNETQMDQQGATQTDQYGMNPETAGAEERFDGQASSSDNNRERVAQRAYELYMARGGGDGQAMEDWLSAERELIQGNENQSES